MISGDDPNVGIGRKSCQAAPLPRPRLSWRNELSKLKLAPWASLSPPARVLLRGGCSLRRALFAQQSDPAAFRTRTPSTPQADVAALPDPPDPPADDSTESMFPHFKDTRFWLSGQANFIFQTHPDFHCALQRPAQPQPALRESDVARDDALHRRAPQQLHREFWSTLKRPAAPRSAPASAWPAIPISTSSAIPC